MTSDDQTPATSPMATASSDQPAKPTSQPAKTIGVLNLVFAPLLILGGLCVGIYMTLLIPNLGKFLEVQQQAVARQLEARRKAEVEDLEQQEADAQTEAAKAAIRARREAILATPLMPPSPELPTSKMGLDDPRLIAHFAADSVTGILLNLLMFVGGIGLVRLRSWGRSLSQWVAALKIVRLGLLAASMIFVVSPMMARKLGALPGGANGAPRIRAMNIGFAAGYALIGSIYPIVTLAVLGRPRVRDACRPGPKWTPLP